MYKLKKHSQIFHFTNNLIAQVRHCQSLALLFENVQNLRQTHKEFKEIKINNLSIKLNSDVVINTVIINQSKINHKKLTEFQEITIKEDGHCIARTMQIMKLLEFNNTHLSLKFYDLKQIIGNYYYCICQRELFLSDQYDCIQPDTIFGEAQVLELKEFEQKNLLNGFIFFCRSFYKSEQILPPIQYRDKHCKCKQSMNPDRKYIMCDVCQLRYYKECIALNKNVQKSFACSSCRKKQLHLSQLQLNINQYQFLN